MITFTNEPLKDLFSQSKLLILNFDEIPRHTPSSQNTQTYFEECEARELDPRQPAHRQRFHNRVLEATGYRYLVSRYGEDRLAMLKGSSIADEGRTIHLGIDIFCKDLEEVYAPCNGEIVVIGKESQSHSFGNYLIMRPDDSATYILLAHLSDDQATTKKKIKVGEPIAKLGDYVNNENGGWSRHLHLQMLRELPGPGEAPIGYSSTEDFEENAGRFPDPMPYFPRWRVAD
ncbi:MAG TPA: peptidoglycan DD-metalloendopeptidase family protein [Candidatus Saccharimonadales bacterium]|nr:peptidoglycan DD-metalloendopeptidase family protein [Candidatus Saccharimonadales bacterium]